ncbi:discoidin domain-containing protein [Terrimonas rubra]|uniref:Discoidin domain-containing protein n=1 Tax=Terrimonas rubra TaxID=1035890 RepID=A0ABW6AAG2_9BACT
MKNKITTAVLSFTIIAALWGCQKKDLPLDGGTVKERQEALESDIKKMLQGAEYGFLLYPESAATSTVVTSSANFTMKFDTLKSQVTMSSSLSNYAGPAMSYYTLSSATGMPLLTFSTSSFISRIYATGDKGITDFFFRVMRISGDTIKVQPYRKGNIYASEGGPVFNMLKIKPSIDIPARSGFDTLNVLMTRYPDNSVSLRNPVKFGAALNIASYSSAVTADLSADLSLVDAYNLRNNTQYKAFPEGSYELIKTKAQIPAGSKFSIDSFEVNIKNFAALQTGTAYILPLKTVAPAPFVLGPKSIAYIILRISNIDPANAAITGGTVASRTGWSVTASGSYSANPVALVLDGNNGTAWSSEGGIPAWLRLDMGAAKTVKGFRLVPSYAYRNENWLQVNVSSSNDGNTWQYIGTYNGSVTLASSNANNPDIKHLSFLTPVSARYFRFDIVRSSDASYTGLGEINAIE